MRIIAYSKDFLKKLKAFILITWFFLCFYPCPHKRGKGEGGEEERKKERDQRRKTNKRLQVHKSNKTCTQRHLNDMASVTSQLVLQPPSSNQHTCTITMSANDKLIINHLHVEIPLITIFYCLIESDSSYSTVNYNHRQQIAYEENVITIFAHCFSIQNIFQTSL